MHYYNLKPLIEESEYLNQHYKKLKTELNDKKLTTEFDNYDKIINYLQQTINEKFNNINVQSINKRTKRGLINGLGSIVKSISGNLDAEDGRKYDKIINHMKHNMKSLQDQLEMQYTVNDKIIQNFNSTIKDIEHNYLVLRSKIVQLSNIIQNKIQQQDILFAKDIFNQLIILYNSVLNVLQDVENSITFCKLQTLHPSIIKTIDLFHELQKIAKFYKDQLPFELNYENILNFESVIKINCKLESERIIYFLSIPINFKENYDLYYLKSIPTIHKSEHVTIIPNTRYLLKHENRITPLRNICMKSAIFQCPSHLISRYNASCEKQVLLHSNSEHCQYTRLNIEDNQLDFIFEINQYLGVFPKEEKIISECEGQTETQNLNGIFLIKNNDCKLIINNEEINYNARSYGTPLIINGLQFKIEKSKLTNFTINLKNLKLEEIQNTNIKRIHSDAIQPKVHIQPSLWTIIIYVISIIIAGFLLIRNRRSKQLENSKIEIQEENPKRKPRLPEDASFQGGKSYIPDSR